MKIIQNNVCLSLFPLSQPGFEIFLSFLLNGSFEWEFIYVFIYRIYIATHFAFEAFQLMPHKHPDRVFVGPTQIISRPTQIISKLGANMNRNSHSNNYTTVQEKNRHLPIPCHFLCVIPAQPALNSFVNYVSNKRRTLLYPTVAVFLIDFPKLKCLVRCHLKGVTGLS